jgi:hypothetical protein
LIEEKHYIEKESEKDKEYVQKIFEESRKKREE